VKIAAFISNSIRRKTMAVVLATTMVALLVNALALLIFEFRSFRDAEVQDVQTQAAILGRTAAPALAFRDLKEADAALRVFGAREDVLAAVLYDPSGKTFASFQQRGEQRGAGTGPDLRAAPAGVRVDGDTIYAMHDIVEGGQMLGSAQVVVRTRLHERVAAYMSILAGVMLLALLVALMLSAWLQRALTEPVLAIDAAARAVIQKRDFSVRAKKITSDEIGVLADAFNRMLVEVEARQAELSAADRRKDEFLATLAHELRNPLAPIRNALYLLDAAPADEKMQANARAVIARQVTQMVRLVDDLIDVSRITTGKLALRRERVELGAVARSAMEAVEPAIKARRHALVVRLPDAPVYLHADATRLAQVFLNLLSNAIKFTDPGGHINFECAVEGGELVVRVRDDGIGIAHESLESIFAMFAQDERSLERAAGGLGVGLALSRRLVELHGGSVVARSAGPGRGSEFTIRLPSPALETAAARAGAGRSPADAAKKRHRILLVDDNQDYATSLAVVLGTMGNDVHVEHDGASALAAVRDFTPDVAILDIGMPRMNGFELARNLRRTPQTVDTILVAITGYGQPADRQRGSEAGFDAYLVKPVEVEQLREILEKY
jgi:signal transduction histidine kinase/CheY-like chemotaxis protein